MAYGSGSGTLVINRILWINTLLKHSRACRKVLGSWLKTPVVGFVKSLKFFQIKFIFKERQAPFPRKIKEECSLKC
jgi:hypothetical protein